MTNVKRTVVCKSCGMEGHRDGSYRSIVAHNQQLMETEGYERTYGNRRIPESLIEYRGLRLIPGYVGKRTKIVDVPTAPIAALLLCERLSSWGLSAKQVRASVAAVFGG